MADNTTLDAGAGGDVISTDDIAGVKVQRVKVQYGVDGSATDVSDSNPLPVDDAGGSLTVDGTVTANLAAGTNNIGDVDVLTLPALPAGNNNIGDVDIASVPAPLSTTGGGTEATALRVTLANDSTGVVSVDDNGSSITVDGSVTVSGTVTADLGSGWPTTVTEDAASAANPTGSHMIARRRDSLAGETSLDGDVVAVNSTDKGEVYVKHVDAIPVTDNGGSITVDASSLPLPTGAATSALQLPNSHDVTIDNAAGAAAVNIQDGGNSITVDGTLNVNLSSGTNIAGKVYLTDGTDDLPIDTAYADAASNTQNHAPVSAHLKGYNGTTWDRLRSDTTNGLDVDVTRLPALVAGSANIGDVDVLTLPSIPAGTNNIGDVDVLTLPALPAGTNNIGDVDVLTLPALPAGTNNIGDVDILTIAAGDNNIGNVDIVTMPNVTLAAGTNTNEVVGDAAHDATIAGNPVSVGGVSQDRDDTAPPNRVSAEGEATRVACDRDGSVFVLPHGPQIWSYHLNTSSAQTDTSVHAAPGAGLSLYVGSITFSSGAATAINLFFEEGASTVLGPFYLEAVAGRGMCVQFNPPKKITANTALTLTTSAAIAHSVDVTGYTAQG